MVLKIYFRKPGSQAAGLTIIVPKEVDKRAVARNKLKRRAREIIRKLLPSPDRRYNLVAVFKKGAEKLTFQELSQKIHHDLSHFK